MLTQMRKLRLREFKALAQLIAREVRTENWPV